MCANLMVGIADNSLWTGSLLGEKNSEEREGKGKERACGQTFGAAIPHSCNYPADHLSVRSLSVNQFRAWVTPGKINGKWVVFCSVWKLASHAGVFSGARFSCLPTRADKGWAVKRALRSSFNVWCGVGLARALFPRFRCAWRPAKFSFLQTGNPIFFL